MAKATAPHDDVFDPAAGRWSANPILAHASHFRSLAEGATYSWGGAKVYSAKFGDEYKHTHGGKSVLVVKYQPTGAVCSECDTVIPDNELAEILASGNASIYNNSFGQCWFSSWTVVPTVVTFDESGKHFYQVIDEVREAAFAEGYNYLDFDFDLAWKRATNSVGGSATPGGRAQRFMYDGSLSTFTDKIFPHEFLHNFGTGHAWFTGAEYGDPYDITGAGSGSIAHVSAATKHRFSWIDPEYTALVNPSSLPMGMTATYTLRAFDVADAPAKLESGEVLTVRLDTRFNHSDCDHAYSWCPSFDGNAWTGSAAAKSDYYLYISYRSQYADAAGGAQLHIAKYAPSGWVEATALLDVRPAGSSV